MCLFVCGSHSPAGNENGVEILVVIFRCLWDVLCQANVAAVSGKRAPESSYPLE